MSTEKKILALVKEYEGEDKLGFIRTIELDYNKTFEIDYDRLLKGDTEQKKTETDESYYQVTVTFTPKKGGWKRSYRVQTSKCETLKMVFLQLQEYLKLEIQKKEINERIARGDLSEDDIPEHEMTIEELQVEKEKAVEREDWKRASEIRDEIVKRKKERQ